MAWKALEYAEYSLFGSVIRLKWPKMAQKNAQKDVDDVQ